MSESIRLTLKYPISANRYWRHAGNNTYVSAEAKAYKTDVAQIGMLARIQPLEGSLSVRVDVYRPQKSGDLDNVLKVLIDSMNGVCYKDDKQITRIEAERHEDKRNPRVEVEIVRREGTPAK